MGTGYPWRDGTCPIPGNEIQVHIVQRSVQPDLVEDMPVYCRGIGLDGLYRYVPINLNYSMIVGK